MIDLWKRIERCFTYHPPKPCQPERYQSIRDHAKEYASLLLALVPDSRELRIALERLEETVMWANAAIARNE